MTMPVEFASADRVSRVGTNEVTDNRVVVRAGSREVNAVIGIAADDVVRAVLVKNAVVVRDGRRAGCVGTDSVALDKRVRRLCPCKLNAIGSVAS